MNTKEDIKKVCKEIIASMKNGEVKKYLSCTEEWEVFERKERNREQQRIKLISRILVRYHLFPDRVIRILSEELLDAMEVSQLKFLLSSLDISDYEINNKLSAG